MKLDKCLCCEGKIQSVVDYGLMPLANNYSVKEKFPLEVMVCEDCKHLQLSEAVDPDILFKDYPYLSGGPKTSIKYFMDFAENTLRYFPKARTVMDIACNDGAQLDAYKQLGVETFGVDPAENLHEISSKKGHKVRASRFEDVAWVKNNKFDIITAQNVVAHTNTPYEFLVNCKQIMHEDSYLFIATSQADMVKNNEYDTLYHEHISYFNTESMKRLVERSGLTLIDVYTVPMHGTSYVFVIKINPEIDPVQQRIKSEIEFGLNNLNTYEKWADSSKKQMFSKKEEIERFRSDGYLIIGCAAAAKGITFLNMTDTKVDYILDTTPTKWYNSVSGSIIMPFEFIRSLTCDKILFVILAWNFETEVKENILKFRKNENDKFITTYKSN